MKKLFLFTSLFVLQINFAQNTFPTTGNIYFDTSLKIGKQEAPATTIGEIVRLSLRPYGHTGGPWNFKTRDISNIAFLDIDYGTTGSALTISSDKNVGIGTTTPTQKLDVNGNINMAGVSGRRLFMGGAGGSTFGIAYDSTYPNYGIFYTEGEPDYVSISPNGNATTGVMNILGNGFVGIGTISPKYNLDVIGTIRAREIKVDLGGADFVFENGYKLMPLSELERFVKDKKHLPEIAPAKEMQENGANLGDLNTKLLQKIEELTLYTIEQNKKIEKQNEKISVLEEKFKKIETVSK